VVRREQRVLDVFGGAYDSFGVTGTRVRADPVDRSRQAYRRNHRAAVVHRGTDRGRAGRSLADALCPTLGQRLFVAEEYTAGRTSLDDQQRAQGNCSSKLGPGLDRHDGQAQLSASHEQLAAFTRCLRKLSKYRCGKLRKARRAEPRATHEQTGFIATNQPMSFERDEQSVDRSLRKLNDFLKVEKADGLLGFNRVQQEHRLIQHSDAADHVFHDGMVQRSNEEMRMKESA